MEPDVVEIAPPPIASGSRTRKPRKSVIPEVIDVEQYEFRNNAADKKNKGKAVQVSSFSDHNQFSNLVNDEMEIDDLAMLQAVLNSQDIPSDVEVVMTTQPWGANSSSKGTAKSSRSSFRSRSANATLNQSLATSSGPQSWDFFSGYAYPQNDETIYSSSTMIQPQTPDIVMMPSPPSRPFKYDASASSSRPVVAAKVVSSAQDNFLRDFKRFDTVEEFSDHHYASKGKASKQHSKNWVKKVQADWKILENDLPETIFVRACESRMDLLRAVIIGAEGTPYHDGLFFFDIQFPDTYPSVPPKVYYHSGGLRINPNLYACGKVCLSLLGTWSGNTREKWIPKESTMLQLLVSIQALILNQKPYFNEPGYERSKGTPAGEAHSKVYSENVFIYSLRTMVYSMRRPPMHFEEFVRSHYFVRAHDIVKACKAYKDGAPLGSMVKGGVQDVEETSQGGSSKFRTDVASFMKTVVEEFVKLGVKELEDKPKPPPEGNVLNATRKRTRSSSIKEFLANIGRCVFQ
ncbi:putative ubiquitin-conjugating enzyme E2 38 isoform X2 [Eutrema salsugineum]|uniref:putative ubiquitin-conjugating enzyme E2 38 isoform X2 n=1 Tax=Eutrema salsugineum TaxID=72664 RepID=UPI000CED187D|nr:putative ubiquitin-conjugating enzyme E2 38 isoform X2 [Eutrema salsugineum]